MGYAPAQSSLGTYFYRIYQPDTEKSVYWLKKAVEKNEADAQCIVGLYYLELKENEKRGMELLKKSAEQGFQDAVDELKKLEKK